MKLLTESTCALVIIQFTLDIKRVGIMLISWS